MSVLIPKSPSDVASNPLCQLFDNRETVHLGGVPSNCSHAAKHVQHDLSFDKEKDTPAFRTVKVSNKVNGSFGEIRDSQLAQMSNYCAFQIYVQIMYSIGR